MHVSEIRSVGDDPESRCALRHGVKRRQREDLHGAVALVRVFGSGVSPVSAVATDDTGTSGLHVCT